MENRQPVITISREYGAGGRTIAKGLSSKLGIPWYDRDFVRLTASLSGYSEDEIWEEGEAISDSEKFWDSIANNIASYTSSHDAIFKAQKEAIYELAKQPCILVGRCANIILRQAGIPSFDVFLYADEEVRVKRAIEAAKHPVEDMRKYVEKRDELRENHYKAYTGKEMTKAQDYHICLDTGVISYDNCLEILSSLYNSINQ